METMVPRELAKPSPRSRLVPIIKVIEAVSILSGGRASIPEVCDVLSSCFDAEKMMIYNGLGYGLADPIEGLPHEEYSGFNERTNITCEFFNVRYWENSQATVFLHKEPFGVGDFLISKFDGQELAQRLWDAILNFDSCGFESFPLDAYKSWSGFIRAEVSASCTKNACAGTDVSNQANSEALAQRLKESELERGLLRLEVERLQSLVQEAGVRDRVLAEKSLEIGRLHADFCFSLEEVSRLKTEIAQGKSLVSLHKMIIGMAVGGYRYNPNDAKSEIPKQISDDLAGCGIGIDVDTVRKYLKRAAEAQLPASRQ